MAGPPSTSVKRVVHASRRAVDDQLQVQQPEKANGQGMAQAPPLRIAQRTTTTQKPPSPMATIPEASTIRSFAASDPNLASSGAGDLHPPFISLRRRPPPQQNPSFNVSEGGGQPGKDPSPRSLSPVSPGPNAINPWATGLGPPALPPGQLGQAGQASGAKRGGEVHGGAASIVPLVSGETPALHSHKNQPTTGFI